MPKSTTWESERSELLAKQISELGLAVHGSRVERLVSRLDEELGARGIAFRPPVYLSDEWGCPDGSPIIGVPFRPMAADAISQLLAASNLWPID